MLGMAEAQSDALQSKVHTTPCSVSYFTIWGRKQTLFDIITRKKYQQQVGFILITKLFIESKIR